MAYIQRLNIIIMKTFTSLLIGCSLALAGAAMAQQTDQQQTPRKKQAAEKNARGPSTTRRERGQASGEAREANRRNEGTRRDEPARRYE